MFGITNRISRFPSVVNEKRGVRDDTLLSERNRRPQQRRNMAMGSTTVDEEPSLLNLGENDRVQLRNFIYGLSQNSKLPNRIDILPRYDAKTLVTGRLLGKGTFSSVYKFRRGSFLDTDLRDESLPTTKSSVSKNDLDGRSSVPYLKNAWSSQHQLKKCSNN